MTLYEKFEASFSQKELNAKFGTFAPYIELYIKAIDEICPDANVQIIDKLKTLYPISIRSGEKVDFQKASEYFLSKNGKREKITLYTNQEDYNISVFYKDLQNYEQMMKSLRDDFAKSTKVECDNSLYFKTKIIKSLFNELSDILLVRQKLSFLDMAGQQKYFGGRYIPSQYCACIPTDFWDLERQVDCYDARGYDLSDGLGELVATKIYNSKVVQDFLIDKFKTDKVKDYQIIPFQTQNSRAFSYLNMMDILMDGYIVESSLKGAKSMDGFIEKGLEILDLYHDCFAKTEKAYKIVEPYFASYGRKKNEIKSQLLECGDEFEDALTDTDRKLQQALADKIQSLSESQIADFKQSYYQFNATNRWFRGDLYCLLYQLGDEYYNKFVLNDNKIVENIENICNNKKDAITKKNCDVDVEM